jgi:membrane protein
MPGKTWSLISDIGNGFLALEALTRGAAIAYYSIFSIAPLLIIVVAIAGLAFGYDAAQGAIVDQLRGLVGQQSAEILQSMIYSAGNRSSGTVATIIGIGTLLLASTGAFGEIQTDAAAEEARQGVLEMVPARLVARRTTIGPPYRARVGTAAS